MKAEEIKKIIEEETGNEVLILSNVRSSPNAIFYITKREHDITPFQIKGFDLDKNKEYKNGFTGCVDLQAAEGRLNFLLSLFN